MTESSKNGVNTKTDSVQNQTYISASNGKQMKGHPSLKVSFKNIHDSDNEIGIFQHSQTRKNQENRRFKKSRENMKHIDAENDLNSSDNESLHDINYSSYDNENDINLECPRVVRRIDDKQKAAMDKIIEKLNKIK